MSDENVTSIVNNLDRILTRLALTEDSSLEQLLSSTLAQVINELRHNDAKIKSKVMEILSHVNKRVRSGEEIVLPLKALSDLYVDSKQSPMVNSFALIYLEMAFSHCKAEDKLYTLIRIMKSLKDASDKHRDKLLRMCIWALVDFREPRTAMLYESQSKKLKSEIDEESSLILSYFENEMDPNIKSLFLKFAQNFLLYQIYNKNINKREGQTIQEAAFDIIPLGLSLADIEKIESKKAPKREDLENMKLSLLKFLGSGHVRATQVFILFSIASADHNDKISKLGEDLLRKHCKIELSDTEVDLEDGALINNIYGLILGQLADCQVNEKRKPVSIALKSKLINALYRSILAANTFPQNLNVVQNLVFGDQSTPSLRRQGMEFAVWIVKHSELHILKSFAPIMLQEIFELLFDKYSALSNDSNVRGFAFQTIGQLAQRIPEAFQNDIEIAKTLLNALVTEQPGVRAQLQEAVSVLSNAYKESEDVEKLLLESILSTESSVRLCAVQWAKRLYPFSHIPARYICICGAGDIKTEIKLEAEEGLNLKNFKKDINPTYPKLSDFLKYILERKTQFLKKANISETLIFDVKIFEYLALFIRDIVLNEGTDKIMEEIYIILLNIFNHALVAEASSELLRLTLFTMLTISKINLNIISQSYGSKWKILKYFLKHKNNEVRKMVIELIGIASMSFPESDLVDAIGHINEGILMEKGIIEDREGSILSSGVILFYHDFNSSNALNEELYLKLFKSNLDCESDLNTDVNVSRYLALSSCLLNKTFLNYLVSKYGDFDAFITKHICEPLIELLKEKDEKILQKAIKALSYTSTTTSNLNNLNLILNGLYELEVNKILSVQEAIGECMCYLFGSINIKRSQITLIDTLMTTSGNMVQQDDTSEDYTEFERSEEFQNQILDDILYKKIAQTKPAVRSASCTWLLFLLTKSKSTNNIIKLRSEIIQKAFVSLLGDRDDIVRDMAAKGVSVIYTVADKEMKDKLMEGLVKVLQGKSMAPKTKLEADTEIFDEGEFGKIPGN